MRATNRLLRPLGRTAARVLPLALAVGGLAVAGTMPASADTETPTASPSPTAAATARPTATATATATPRGSATPSASATPTPPPTPRASATPTPTPTPRATASPTATPTPVPAPVVPAAAGAPALSVAVAVAPTPVTRAGQQLTYTVTVRNTGDQTLRDVVATAVARDLHRLGCVPVAQGGTLAAGASTVCTGTRTTLPGDLGNPGPAVTATAVGISPAGTGVSATGSTRAATATLPPKVTNDTVAALFGTASVLLPGSSNDSPGEPGGPAIDRTATLFPDGITPTGQRGSTRLSTSRGDWQALEDGSVRFLPSGEGTTYRSGFTETVRYTTYDTAGHSTIGSLTVTMRPGPVAQDDAATTTQGDPVVVHPLANDKPGGILKGAPATLLTSSLRFTPNQPTGEDPVTDAVVSTDGKTMTIPYKGTLTVVDDTIRYAPAPTFLDSFTVGYTVADSALNVAHARLSINVLDPEPTLTDDAAVTTYGRPVPVPALQDDAPATPAHALRLAGFDDSGHTFRGRTLTTPEGTWSADEGSDVPVFSPAAGFSGVARAEYAVDEVTAAGLVLGTPRHFAGVWGGRHTAQLAVTVRGGPSARPLVLSTPHDVRASVDPTSAATPSLHLDGTRGRFVPTRTVFTTGGQPAGSRVTDAGRTLVLAAGGTLGVDAATGRVTYAPTPGFVGFAGTVGVLLEDDTTAPGGTDGETVVGRLAVLATGTAPVATGDDATTTLDTPVRLAGATNDFAGTPAAPLTVDLPPAGQPGGSVLSSDGKRLTVPGEGSWTVGSDGSVTFAPVAGFVDGTSPVSYRVRSSAGSATAALGVSVLRGAVARPDLVTLPSYDPTWVDPVANDVAGRNANGTLGSVNRASLRFPSSGQPAGATVSADGTRLDLPARDGLPAFSAFASASDGAVVLTAADSRFRATSPAFRYSVQATTYDSTGLPVRTTISSTFRVHFTGRDPIATDDSTTVATGRTASLSGASNDIPSGPATQVSGLEFPADQLASLPAGSTTGKHCYDPDEGCFYYDLYVRVPGEGYWQTNYTGLVTFAPDPGFVGRTSPVRYRTFDEQGRADATLTVTVLPPAVVRPDAVSTPQGVPVTVDVLANDTPARAPDGTVVPLDPDGLPFGYLTGEPTGSTVVDDSNFRTLVVPHEGRYRVEYGTARITFTPEPTFRGLTSPVYFLLGASANGLDDQVKTRFQVHVDPVDPTAAPDTATAAGGPVQIPVGRNDAPGTPVRPLAGASLRLRTTPGLPAGSAVTSVGQTLTVAGRGTFAVAGDGTLWFYPLAGTSGTLPPVRYDVADANGTRALSTVTVRVTP